MGQQGEAGEAGEEGVTCVHMWRVALLQWMSTEEICDPSPLLPPPPIIFSFERVIGNLHP